MCQASKAGGAVNFVNNGAIVIDNAGANGNGALFLSGNGGGVTYSGTGTISNHANTPDSAGLAIASDGGIGGTNLIEVAGSITGSFGIDTADGTTTIVVTGTVTGTGGNAIIFDNASSNNTVDLKPTAVVTGNLDGSGNDDTVRLSGTSGSGTFDLGKVGADFSALVKGEAATWTVTGTLDPAVGTVVRNGTLLVDGTVGTVLVTDGFGDDPPALLGGTGTVGNVIVQSAGILAPGASAGTLTSTGDVTLSIGSIFRVEIGGTTAGSQYDVLHLNGTGLSGLIDLGSATIQASLIGGFTPTVGQVFKIIDNDDIDAVSNTFAGMSEGAGVLVSGQAFRVSYVGGDGNDVTLTAIVGGSNPPGLTGFGPSVEIEQAGPAAVPQVLDGDVVFTDPDNNFNSGTLTVSGLLAEATVSVLSLGFDPGEFLIDDVAGPVDDLYFEGVLIGGISGGTGSTLNVTFNANANSSAIDALIQNLTFLDSSSNPTFSRTLSLNVTDAGAGSTGPNLITVKAFNGVIETGGAGDDSFTHHRQRAHRRRRRQRHVTFGFRLVDATVSYSRQPGDHRRPVDPHRAHRVRDVRVHRRHGRQQRRRPAGRRPVLLFPRITTSGTRTSMPTRTITRSAGTKAAIRTRSSRHVIYLGANPDVKAAGVDPLTHFHLSGWQEGRVPSLNFDPGQYLAANPGCCGRARRPARALPGVRRGGGAPAVHAERAGRRQRLRLFLLPAAQSRRRRRAASIRSSTSRRSAGTRGAIRTRCSTSTAIFRPMATWRRHRSIRSITTTRSAGTKGAIHRPDSTPPSIWRPMATWRRRTSTRSRTSFSSASTRAARRSRTACGGSNPGAAHQFGQRDVPLGPVMGDKRSWPGQPSRFIRTRP